IGRGPAPRPSKGPPMRMRPVYRRTTLALATLVPLTIGISALVGLTLRPPPSLDEVVELSNAGRFDEAEARGEAYLQSSPDAARALLVMAELAMARRSPAPDRALDRLGRIRAESPEMAAWVLVDRGRAYDLLGRYDRAEACWIEA